MQVLERGGWTDRSDYPGASPAWELASARAWSSNPNVRRSESDSPIDVADSDVGLLDFAGVGGATVLYNAQWPRMLPDDFRVRSVDGVADDWPLTWHDLLPHYERTEVEFGVSGVGGDPTYPHSADPPLPGLPIGEAGLRVARAHHRLGWHWWPARNAIASVPHRHQRPCVQRGSCGQGCNEGAKGSTDITHWNSFVTDGGVLTTGASVRRILLDDDGSAHGVEWIDRDGASRVSTARVVLLAANAIGTARLLLGSTDERHPDGIANSSGLVGRNLMVHPLSTVVGVFDDDLHGWKVHNGAVVQCLEFARSDPSRGFVRGSTWGLGTSGGPLRMLLTPDPDGVWGGAHHRHVRSRLGHIAQWAVLCEDLPDPDNCVVLEPSGVGGSLPAARIEYRLSENSRRMMAFMTERAAESLLAAGARSVEVTEFVANGHLMGTARMGIDPRDSVVDPWGMCHDVPNLGVIDGSVFVTSGSANPTSTIAALASRFADRLIERRQELHLSGRASTSLHSTRHVHSVPVTSTTIDLDDRLLERLSAMADGLIPADSTMPAPSSLDLRPLLTTVLTWRGEQAEHLLRALDGDDDPEGALERLAVDDPRALRALRTCVAGAYYLDPSVRAALDWHPETAEIVTIDGYPQWVVEGLVDHLV